MIPTHWLLRQPQILPVVRDVITMHAFLTIVNHACNCWNARTSTPFRRDRCSGFDVTSPENTNYSSRLHTFHQLYRLSFTQIRKTNVRTSLQQQKYWPEASASTRRRYLATSEEGGSRLQIDACINAEGTLLCTSWTTTMAAKSGNSIIYLWFSHNKHSTRFD